ncbi:MAG: hypothetical protein GX752_03170 [Clostridium sp.]|nr:hypothetical protein [Clostridium sp.]
MKKILSLIVTMVFVLSLGMVAFAETDPAGNTFGDQTQGDWTNVKFKKSITTIENTGALHPAETFEFTVIPVSAKDEQNNDITPIPDIGNFNIAVTEGSGYAIATVDLPYFNNIGTYVYKVAETASDTAGMGYDANEYTFTVVVLNDGQGQRKRLILKKSESKDATTGQKTDVFDNKYDAGSLVVNKEITGNNANFEETFPVKVTLTASEGKKINSTISVAGVAGNEGTVVQTGNGTNEIVITFDVTNESNVIISNIPYDVRYVVEETNLRNYTATYDDNKTGSIGAASIATKITNDLSRDIATGIFLDSLPYVILLGAAAVGIVFLVVRKRKQVNF